MTILDLEVSRHFFASVAEEMGAALMRASFSPNIKERRDFSCAVFDAAGRMVAQAAHIPVHLGSTPMSVRAALDAFEFVPGMTVALNDPYCGGTHLPDVTLVTGVFDAHQVLRFLVANRAHHADVGGITPGSMPLSAHIDDEGFRFGPTVLNDAFVRQFCDASRTPDERAGDLQAQLASNHRGVERLAQALESTLHADRTDALLAHSEMMMRQVLREIPDGRYTFSDVMDSDGMGTNDIPISVTVTVEGETIMVDFSDAPDQVRGPVNVPRAVTASAVYFAVRCLAPEDMPSNDGFMRCVDVVTRPGSVLDAAWPAPVAIGNVETSQRVADVVFGALAQALPHHVCAASQGTMNNTLIGGIDPRTGAPFSYYETIAGGMGAGEGVAGASALHSHMTNTLNTPVEALEHAYPFRVVRYAVRRHTGGRGTFRGGDGVERVYRCPAGLTVTLMTERRTSAPYGLAGGAPGARGSNILVRDGVRTELPDKVTFVTQEGDDVIVQTPGGGGFGQP
ncbi:MAG: hydantoinase B/oxoprolinase family protein [bacterium]